MTTPGPDAFRPLMEEDVARSIIARVLANGETPGANEKVMASLILATLARCGLLVSSDTLVLQWFLDNLLYCDPGSGAYCGGHPDTAIDMPPWVKARLDEIKYPETPPATPHPPSS